MAGKDVLQFHEHIAGELHLTQHVGDLVGVEHTTGRPARDHVVPLAGIDPLVCGPPRR